ncbi:MAG: rhomboid family intramembrane serine protease [Planctomycetota bacterium]|jgi:membrane associated rhomboid family serine protease
MGLYDREYTQEHYRPQSRYASVPWRAFFWVTPVVKQLLITNIMIFLMSAIIPLVGEFVLRWFSVRSSPLVVLLQPWRLVTYQFLHGGFGHLFGNMLGLFFFGRILEKHWGSKRFLYFYLVCGAVGGLLYPLLAYAGLLSRGSLIGASGAVFGVLAAVAILFPRVAVYIWGILPIPMMFLALLYLVMIMAGLLSGENAGGQVAHLAGMATGAAYVISRSWRPGLKLKIQAGRWEKKMAAQRSLQLEVDRILQKVHDSGIQSLTSKEKRTLKKATEAERTRNKL